MPVDRATVERLRRHDWGAEPFESVKGGTEPYRTKLVDGRCFFLEPDSRCRIHREISYDAKPAACRAFPLAVLDVHGTQHARLSYWCPTVVENLGKPLEHQMQWVRETARHADARRQPITVVDGSAPLNATDVGRVHEALCRWLRDPSILIGDRLARGAAFLQRLGAAGRQSDARETRNLLAGASLQLTRDPSSDAPGHAAAGKRVLALFLVQDGNVGRLRRLTRLASTLLAAAGVISLRSPSMQARARWGAVLDVEWPPRGDGLAVLERYLVSKVEARRYLAGESTLVGGYNAIVAGYGMVSLLARMKAASEGRRACTLADVERALSVADLLVVEHRGASGRLRRITETALGDTALYANLRACLGA